MPIELVNNSPGRRIAHVTTVHSRCDTRILLKECSALNKAGYEVHLVVGDGLGDAVIDGIQIHDIGAKPESRIKRMWAQAKRAREKVIEIKPDVVHLHDPELLPMGVKLAKNGICIIYDAHEDVPRQILSKHWIPPFLRALVAKAVEIYENGSARRLSGVVAATPHIDRRFSGQGLQTVNVNNYPLTQEFAPVEGGIARLRRVCYIGGISRMRGLLQVVQALPLVPDVRMTLCGDIGEPGFDTELRAERGWSQVDYLGIVDRKTVRRVMGESSAGLVTFLSAPNHVDAQPNKLFEYMSSELPVIASNFPLWREIIEGANCGLCVNPDSPEQIAAAIRRLLDSPSEVERMGRAGRQAVLSKYNWPLEAQKLVGFYKARV